MSAGKGDKPRNCFSKEFKNNYDQIKWSVKKEEIKKDKKPNSYGRN